MLREKFIKANENENCNITIDDFNQFKVAAKELSMLFNEINTMTISMQIYPYLLKDYREDLDSLIEASTNG